MADSALTDKIRKAVAQGRKALIPYLPGGFPDRDAFWEHLAQLDAGGADVIEIGVPFSRPSGRRTRGGTGQPGLPARGRVPVLDTGRTLHQTLVHQGRNRAHGLHEPVPAIRPGTLRQGRQGRGRGRMHRPGPAPWRNPTNSRPYWPARAWTWCTWWASTPRTNAWPCTPNAPHRLRLRGVRAGHHRRPRLPAPGSGPKTPTGPQPLLHPHGPGLRHQGHPTNSRPSATPWTPWSLAAPSSSTLEKATPRPRSWPAGQDENRLRRPGGSAPWIPAEGALPPQTPPPGELNPPGPPRGGRTVRLRKHTGAAL